MAQVLVLEPDARLGKIYKARLEQAGHRVVVAQNGQAAICEADEKTPDIIVLEPQLAIHNGIEFLYELRSYEEWWRVPVIFHTLITPEAFAFGREALQELGVAAYLYKPHTKLAQLAAQVGECLGKEAGFLNES